VDSHNGETLKHYLEGDVGCDDSKLDLRFQSLPSKLQIEGVGFRVLNIFLFSQLIWFLVPMVMVRVALYIVISCRPNWNFVILAA